MGFDERWIVPGCLLLTLAFICGILVGGCEGAKSPVVPYADGYTDGYLTARDSCIYEMGVQRPDLFSTSIRDTFLNYDGGLWKRVPR